MGVWVKVQPEHLEPDEVSEVVHPQGADFEIVDGCLVVRDDAKNVITVWAAGHWRQAQTEPYED